MCLKKCQCRIRILLNNNLSNKECWLLLSHRLLHFSCHQYSSFSLIFKTFFFNLITISVTINNLIIFFI